MPDILQSVLLFCGVGGLAGFINVMGGGGSALTLPALLFLGLDPVTANGTNRVAIILQNVSATTSFKIKGLGNIRKSAFYSLVAIPGAIVGAMIAVELPDRWFETVLTVVMVGIVLTMVIPRGQASATKDAKPSKWIYPTLFGIGLYGGFIQVGVGFMIMAAFYHLLKMDLVTTTVHKVIIIMLYTIPSLLVFSMTGNVDWWAGFGLAAGNATGAWIAARVAIRNGDKIVRFFLIVAALMMIARLLGLFPE